MSARVRGAPRRDGGASPALEARGDGVKADRGDLHGACGRGEHKESGVLAGVRVRRVLAVERGEERLAAVDAVGAHQRSLSSAAAAPPPSSPEACG